MGFLRHCILPSLALFLVRVFAIPQASFANVSTAIPTSAASSVQSTSTLTAGPHHGSHTSACACYYQLNASMLLWATLDVTTLTATTIYIVNNATNSTSISINADNATFTSTTLYTPFPTNDQGIPTTIATVLDDNFQPSTTVLAYPNILVDYDPDLIAYGPFPTALANGSTVCTTPTDDGIATLALPSHPLVQKAPVMPIPAAAVTAVWTNIQTNLGPLFPGFDPMQCTVYFPPGSGPAASFLTPVAYLTEVSTMYVSQRDLEDPKPSVVVPAPPQDTQLPSGSPQTESSPPSPATVAPGVPPGVDSPTVTATAIPPAGNPVAGSIPNFATQTGGLPAPESDSPVSPGTEVGDHFVSPAPTTLFQPPPPVPAPVFTVGTSAVTAVPDGSALVIASQTLVPGGPPITLSGTPLSMAVSAAYVVIGTSTIPLPSFAPNSPSTTTVFTIAGNAVTATEGGTSLLIAGQTLVPGGSPVTISGTPVSLAPSASYLVVGSSTIPLPTNNPMVLTLGTETFTANSLSQFLVAGQTLVPGGPAITVSGTPISLAPGATAAVVGSNSDSQAESQSSLPTQTDGSDTSAIVSDALQTEGFTPTTANIAAKTATTTGGSVGMGITDIRGVGLTMLVAVAWVMS